MPAAKSTYLKREGRRCVYYIASLATFATVH
jgi:hypothetical protein